MVDAFENKQGLFYTWCTMNTANEDGLFLYHDMFEGCEKIVVAIIQPSDRRENVLDIWETTPDEIAEFGEEMAWAIWRSKSGEDDLCEGDHCAFCPVAPTCPLKLEAVNEALEHIPNELDVRNITELLELADKLEPWIKEVRKLAHDTLERGGRINNWKLVAKRATRHWIDDTKALKYLKRILKSDNATVKKIISPAQAEKKAKEMKLEKFDISRLCEKISTGTTLTREDDKRETYEPPADLGEALNNSNVV
jgi:hypothetical protein